jgi:hypothetical protein
MFVVQHSLQVAVKLSVCLYRVVRIEKGPRAANGICTSTLVPLRWIVHIVERLLQGCENTQKCAGPRQNTRKPAYYYSDGSCRLRHFSTYFDAFCSILPRITWRISLQFSPVLRPWIVSCMQWRQFMKKTMRIVRCFSPSRLGYTVWKCWSFTIPYMCVMCVCV